MVGGIMLRCLPAVFLALGGRAIPGPELVEGAVRSLVWDDCLLTLFSFLGI